jgi:hypothetical protein
MVPTMIGTKILRRAKVNLFQGTKKLKMALPKESLRDYLKNLPTNSVNQTPRNVGSYPKYLGGAGYPKRRQWRVRRFWQGNKGQIFRGI